jgi:hypothetical protein
MKTLLRIALSLVALVVIIGVIAYADGASLPLDHSTSVTGIVPAPPDKVFARITDVANGSTWRPQVKSVTMLPPDAGRDHWTEDLGHGQTMTFLATRTDTPTRRDVLLDVPGAAYGGTWTYELSPGPTPGATTLKITETGFINPPMYRFMMHHILGMTYNLDTYMKDMQNSFKS